MVERIITEKEAGQRLNKYAMKYLNQAPSSFIYKMLRKKNITLNGKKASGDEILASGDSLKFFLSDETIAGFRKEKSDSLSAENNQKNSNHTTKSDIQILYQDSDILAVHKPAGILSQKAGKNDISINEMIVAYCLKQKLVTKEEFETFTPSVCNRLDRNTSGIILAGITLRGSQTLSKALKNRDYHKFYNTIVQGEFKKKIHEVCYIKKNHNKNVSTVVRGEKAKRLEQDYNSKNKVITDDYDKIETGFEAVSVKNGFSLLKVTLYTGKSHQIRAHLKALGYPILGDSKYGSLEINRKLRDKYHLKHHLLHAGELQLDNGIIIKDELPDYFTKIWAGISG